ncbi:hypothetical protein N7537_001342 [Penicillium hordei]|uniref:Uncharacterized protein n=1 Tax=Penicillium hordei TaxID=40994 RepID=A0AAD6H6V6_9EURO|nr:uncharacterized protein N7537_001342 [Penicillium hordei]KAJ5616228.1 hypothetical protein N7537_001342 [Penicillium hordei]
MAKDRAFCGPLNSDDNYIPTNDGTAERGTNDNPIVIKEDSEQEGSKTNPIVINDDADALDKEERSVQNDFTRDTEPLSTPEFCAILRNLGDQGFHVPQNKPTITDLAYGLPSSQSVYGQISDCTCSPEPESIHNDHLEEERPQVAKSDNDKETPPNKDKSCGLIAETDTSCGQPNFSWSSQGEELEPSPKTSQADSGNPLRLQRSGKRKREHEGENNYVNRRSNRLANKRKNDWNSSVLTS